MEKTDLDRVASPPAAATPSAADIRGRAPATIEPAPVAVTIEYCAPTNLLRHARALADALLAELGVRAELAPAAGGVFEVTVDVRLVFSKRATTRLPEADEIFYHVRAALESRRR